ncbi:hypothetical protein Vretimale_5287, partial [Volvox reticuliferus]
AASASDAPPAPVPHQTFSNATLPPASPHSSRHTTTSVVPNTTNNRYGGHYLTRASENIISGANTRTLRSGVGVGVGVGGGGGGASYDRDDLPPQPVAAAANSSWAPSIMGGASKQQQFMEGSARRLDAPEIATSGNNNMQQREGGREALLGARAPLAPMDQNQLDDYSNHLNMHAHAQQQGGSKYKRSGMASTIVTTAANRRVPPPPPPPAAASQDAPAPSVAGPPLAAPTSEAGRQLLPSQPQQQQPLRRQAAMQPPPIPGAAMAVRPPASRQQQQQGAQPQSVQQQPYHHHQYLQPQRMNPLDYGRELSFAGMPLAAAGASQPTQQQLLPGSRSRCRDEQPQPPPPPPQQQQQQQQRQSIDLQLQQVLNLAKELQSKCR